MAMVFQSYALYPHMSVRENLRFGLVCQGVGKAEIASRIARAAEILQIGPLLQRSRRSCRAARANASRSVARSSSSRKRSCSMNRLSNLDAELRVKMRSEIAALHRRLGATMIYVTHDQVEAMTMADTIVVLRDGIVEQVGSPIELYVRPRNRFVACFLGAPQMNILSAIADGAGGGQGLRLKLDQGRALVESSVWGRGIPPGTPLEVGVRPEHLAPGDVGLRARVEASEILGAETIIHAALESGELLVASLRGIHRVARGENIGLEIDQQFLHVFNGAGDALPPNGLRGDVFLKQDAHDAGGQTR